MPHTVGSAAQKDGHSYTDAQTVTDREVETSRHAERKRESTSERERERERQRAKEDTTYRTGHVTFLDLQHASCYDQLRMPWCL